MTRDGQERQAEDKCDQSRTRGGQEGKIVGKEGDKKGHAEDK